ncbi:glycoside hydrolase family 30 protein [Saccharopolyspora taberi]|uniref:Glucosylceramidase n=1 Tax=Saccharopolyspora taberi TaxID=60895 RepID=A0ABN3VL05_9PSEU
MTSRSRAENLGITRAHSPGGTDITPAERRNRSGGWRAICRPTAVLAAAVLLFSTPAAAPPEEPDVRVWLTTADARYLLAERDGLDFRPGPDVDGVRIHVKPGETFQTMAGFGASFTESAASLVASHPRRDELMRDLFDPADPDGAALSALRQPIGSSDFATGPHYTYDDARGEDWDLGEFDMSRDRTALELVGQARRMEPRTHLTATPWSPPAWMKTNRSLIGGDLRDEAYPVYAEYLARVAREYERAGTPLDAITPQNEPLLGDPGDYPGMALSPEEESRLVRELRPRLGGSPEILGFDHNWARHPNDDGDPRYPFTLMSKARKHLAGTAYHCYHGDAQRQSELHDSFPDKDIHLTECSPTESSDPGSTFRDTLMWMTRDVVIGATRNWARSVVLWNVALDPAHGPHNGGCSTCDGLLEIDPATGEVRREAGFYALGHASRFVRPGAVRINSFSVDPQALQTVAFRNPDGTTAVLLSNPNPQARTATLIEGDRYLTYDVPAESVTTLTWRG